MENSSRALYIAGSVLIAVMIISLLVLTFNKIGDSQSAKDKVKQEQSVTAFNVEYEAFNKRIMYGADVISCLNKAVSNNEEAEDNKDPDAYVDVRVKLRSDINEELAIYLYKGSSLRAISLPKDKNDDNSEEHLIRDELDGFLRENKRLFSQIFEIDKSTLLTGITDGSDIIVKDLVSAPSYTKSFVAVKADDTTETDGDGYYYLVKNKKLAEKSKLKKLTNTSQEYKADFERGNNKYCIKWTSAFKDFKKRAFKCEGIEYDDNTGRVCRITFVEADVINK